MKMTIEEALQHCGLLINNRVEERAREAIPHYMWLFREGKDKAGVCSHCHSILHGKEELERNAWISYCDPYLDQMEYDEFRHPDWYKNDNRATCEARHNEQGYCAHCGALITYKEIRYGRKNMQDQIFLLDYRKSRVDANTICLIGFETEANWNKELHTDMPAYEFSPEISIIPSMICIFSFGRGAARFTRRRIWEAEYDPNAQRAYGFCKVDLGFQQCSTVDACYTPYGKYAHVPFIRHKEDMREALEGTAFGRILELADYERNAEGVSLINWMKRSCRAPALEYLFKLGMDKLALHALNGELPQNFLHLQRKTAWEVLQISKDCWGFIKSRKLCADAEFLRVHRHCRTFGIPAGHELQWRYSRLHTAATLGRMGEYLPSGMLKKAMQYILKKGISGADYADHLKMLRELNEPLTNTALLFPADFGEMHARLSMRMDVKTNREEQAKLEKFLAKIKGFRFSALGLVLAPIASIALVIKEGTALSHCVGTYAKRYAGGGCILCTLREEEKMDVPLYTVEFTLDGRMIQCRGYKNKQRLQDEDRLRDFFRLFQLMREDMQRNRGRGRKTA